MKGFKVFNSNFTCMGFQYDVGQTYEMEGIPALCKRGFHFCEKAVDCFNFYDFNPSNKVAEVEALGVVFKGKTKCVTNQIRIVREIPWSELLELVNSGLGNTGRSNSGNSNSGNWNSGNSNSGISNSGHFNSGNFNSGNFNSGDWNKASQTLGCFNTESQKLKFFDKETNLTMNQWRFSYARSLLSRIDFRRAEWIWTDDMTDEEKAEHPEHKTTGGYLRLRDHTDCCAEWWKDLTEEEKQTIKDIPNFNAEKFKLITGIEV